MMNEKSLTHPPSDSKLLIELENTSSKIAKAKHRATFTKMQQALRAHFTSAFRHVATFFHEMTEWTFGFITMLIVLAFISVIPILNFISLGYLIQMGSHVAESGKLRKGLVGIKKSAVLGRMALGTWLCLWPSKFLFELKIASELTDLDGSRKEFFEAASFILLFITFIHIFWACLRGGKIHHFLWPAPLKFIRWLKEPHSFMELTKQIKPYFSDLSIKSYFKLGAQAFFGASIWLALPISLLIFASYLPPVGVLISIPAGVMLMWVVLHLPFLQIHLARKGYFKAIFEWKAIRHGFSKAPLLSWLALFLTLLFATPLYLLKIELTPKEIAWLPSLIFILFIFPARLFVGWAMHYSEKRKETSHWLFRWMGRFAALPILLAYVVLVFITQYLSWNGSFSLLEQHAFLVPAPLIGL